MFHRLIGHREHGRRNPTIGTRPAPVGLSTVWRRAECKRGWGCLGESLVEKVEGAKKGELLAESARPATPAAGGPKNGGHLWRPTQGHMPRLLMQLSPFATHFASTPPCLSTSSKLIMPRLWFDRSIFKHGSPMAVPQRLTKSGSFSPRSSSS